MQSNPKCKITTTCVYVQIICFCDKNWYMMDDQCHTPGVQELKYPYNCPMDYIFWPGRFMENNTFFGPPIDYRVHTFMDHPLFPDHVKVSSTWIPRIIQL